MTDTEREEARRLYIQAYQRRQYARRKAARLCTACGKPLREGYTLTRCPPCRERGNAAMRRYQQNEKRRLLKKIKEVIQ